MAMAWLSGMMLAASALAAQTLVAPAVDRTGSVVVFALGDEGAPADLYVSEAGGAPRRLTALEKDGVTAVSLAPDGRTAAFAAGGEIRLIDVASGEVRVVAAEENGAASPHLTDDGTRILYAAASNHPFRAAAADGSGTVRLAPYTGTLAPSPQRVVDNAGLVVFSSPAPFGPTFAPSAADLCVTDMAGTEIRQVTHFGNRPEIWTRNATISAAGGLIAFESNVEGADNPQVWLVLADGGGLRQMTFGPEPAASPSLSADGKIIVWVQAGRVWAARTDDPGSARPLTGEEGPAAREVVLSGDGSRAVFSSGSTVSTIETGLTIE